jgi:signal peptidase I
VQRPVQEPPVERVVRRPGVQRPVQEPPVERVVRRPVVARPVDHPAIERRPVRQVGLPDSGEIRTASTRRRPPTRPAAPTKPAGRSRRRKHVPLDRPGLGYAGIHRGRRARRQLSFWQEMPLLVLVAFGLALLIKTFLLQAFFIPSGSMENTLAIRDRVLVNKLVYDTRTPHRGEIVVFRATDSWAPEVPVEEPQGLARVTRTLGSAIGVAPPDEKDVIKRVIGVGGDTVRCCDDKGRVQVNGHSLDEPYVFDNTPLETRPFGPVVVPQGRMFVMGDHRGVSQDSRAYLDDQFRGTIPVDQVVGQAFSVVWPFDRWHRLPVPGTFPGVPKPGASRPAVGDSTGGSTGGRPRSSPTPGAALVALPVLVFAGRRRRFGLEPYRPDGEPAAER